MVEGAPLLREYTGNGIEGSNPFFSATIKLQTPNSPISAPKFFFVSKSLSRGDRTSETAEGLDFSL